jgi:uncharacterized cupredoxin-like copper-binding protein
MKSLDEQKGMTMKKPGNPNRVLMLGALAIALLVAACGNGEQGTNADTQDDAGNEVVEITVHATEFAFDPDPIEVSAGVPVTIVLINDGVVEHDLTIDSVGLSIHADPGETARETVTFVAGTYEVHCTVPGHHEAGMMTTLVAR